MDAAIETSQLTKIFRKPQGWFGAAKMRPVAAVSGVDLDVKVGELFGLLGPNGAGKTTLVKMLCTLILPTSGTATVSGHPLSRAGKIRASVGLVVSDERSFYWRLSARRNLEFFAALYGIHGQGASERINTVLAHVDLEAQANDQFSTFSSGMKQRLAIARSLLHRPEILFLDEPSRGLDPTATRRLHEQLKRLMTQQELTIFLITHDLTEAENLCHRVSLMHRGQIHATGRPGELRRQLRPQRHYTIISDKVDADTINSLQHLVPALQHQPMDQHSNLDFWAGEQDGLLTAVVDRLRENRLAIYSVEGVPPTLEEVFAHFTKDG
jgi:ABC-2 type transport system ATP-binding protein